MYSFLTQKGSKTNASDRNNKIIFSSPWLGTDFKANQNP